MFFHGKVNIFFKFADYYSNKSKLIVTLNKLFKTQKLCTKNFKVSYKQK
jgi:hypothetical protein